MPKSRDQKKLILKSLINKISQAKSIIFTNYNAIPVKDSNILRRKLKAEDSEYIVTKKTLLDLALKENKIEGVDTRALEGKLAVVLGYGDQVAPAKVVDEYRKKNEDKIAFLGGILDGAFIDTRSVLALAQLPSKQELLAKLVGSLNAPVSGFVNVLAGNIRGLMNVLKAIEEKKA